MKCMSCYEAIVDIELLQNNTSWIVKVLGAEMKFAIIMNFYLIGWNLFYSQTAVRED